MLVNSGIHPCLDLTEPMSFVLQKERLRIVLEYLTTSWDVYVTRISSFRDMHLSFELHRSKEKITRIVVEYLTRLFLGCLNNTNLL